MIWVVQSPRKILRFRRTGATQCNFVRAARLAGQERVPNRVCAKVDFLSEFKLMWVSGLDPK